MDKTTIDKVKAANPGVELGLVKVPDANFEAIFKMANDPDWAAFRKDQADDAGGYLSLRNLLLLHVAYPTREELTATFDARPGLAETAGKQYIKFVGASLTASVEKV